MPSLIQADGEDTCCGCERVDCEACDGGGGITSCGSLPPVINILLSGFTGIGCLYVPYEGIPQELDILALSGLTACSGGPVWTGNNTSATHRFTICGTVDIDCSGDSCESCDGTGALITVTCGTVDAELALTVTVEIDSSESCDFALSEYSILWEGTITLGSLVNGSTITLTNGLDPNIPPGMATISW